MMRWQFPPRSIFIGGQGVLRLDVPTQRMPLPAAIEANNIVARNRTADGYRWGRRLRFRRLPQRQQRLIDRVDERRHVGW
jgi:hypothetical protein